MKTRDIQDLVVKLKEEFSGILKTEFNLEFPTSYVLGVEEMEALQKIIIRCIDAEIDPIETRGSKVLKGRLPGRSFVLRRKKRTIDGQTVYIAYLSDSTVRRLFQKAWGSHAGSFYSQNREIFSWLFEHKDLKSLALRTRPNLKGTKLSPEERALARDIFSECEKDFEKLLMNFRRMQRLLG